LLATGALLAAAALPFTANAAISVNDPTTGPVGELWVTVWDPVGQQSYQQDLGIDVIGTNFNTLNTSIDLGANFATFLGGVSDVSKVRYAVFGTNGQTGAGNGIWSTSTTNDLDNADAEFSIVQNWRSTLVAAGQGLNAGNTDFAADVSSIATPTGSNAAGYFGAPALVGTLGGTATFITNAALGQDLFFYFVGRQRISGVTSDFVTLFAGAWNLTGQILTYGAGTPPPIPLPAGFWLLGSALLGLVGIARRKTAAVA
jgi:hypothetical protein